MADISPHSIAYTLYAVVRKAVKLTGLIGPARRLAGPLIGRLLFKMSPGGSGPSRIRGHKMFLASSNGYPPADMGMAKYEPKTTELFEEIIKPGMVVIDIGAHVGYYSLLAARLAGDTGRIYAFEPEPANYANLIKNINLNDYHNVQALNLGVTANMGYSTLYLTSLDNGRHSMHRRGDSPRGSIEVETTTIDDFLESEDWPQIDLIKVDVEGAEIDVLNGMSDLLAKPNDLKLIIEFNPVLIRSGLIGPETFMENLKSLGFQVLGIDEKKGPLPLEEFGPHFLFEKLLATEGSINLYCTKTCANIES